MSAKKVLDGERMSLAIQRMGMSIAQSRSDDLDDLVIIGIRTRGIHVGNRVVREIEKLTDRTISHGFLDPVLFRDDLMNMWPKPIPRPSKVPRIDRKYVFLVDDVLDRGRTILAAINNLHSFGRPASIAIAVLVERLPMNTQDSGHRREIPFYMDVIGKSVMVDAEEWIKVKCVEEDGEDAVYIVNKEGGTE
jgi:pyrimidine operon attenuation protein/uracil phosphoribosyltransferase